MTFKLKSIVVGFLIMLGLLFPLTPAFAADIFNDVCQQGTASDSAVCQQRLEQNKNPNKNPAVNAIRIVANGFALAAGVAAVIMIIISGFRFVTGGGSITGQRSADPNRIKSARATLTASIIGLLVIIFAWAVVRLITDRLLQ